MRKLASLPLALGLLALPVFGGPITTDGSYYQFGFQGVGSLATDCIGCVVTTPPADQTVNSPWTFSGSAVLFVLDLFLSTDSFIVYNNNVAIGSTSAPIAGGTCGGDIACAIADPSYSRGSFVLGPGDHSITIEVQNGGVGAGVLSVTAADVPEPSTFGMLGAGLIALGFGLRRRKRA